MMGYYDYRASHDNPGLQHNIMALVGNGFDIQALRHLGARVDTSYEHFYEFLKRRHFNPENPILLEMERLLGTETGWSDIEAAVTRLVSTDRGRSTQIVEALAEMQGQFADFLQSVAPASTLELLGRESMANKWARASLSEFLRDLSEAEYGRLSFLDAVDNGDIYNFLFINFNYTTLLDDYIYLDSEQFKPRLYKGSDRNFSFDFDPNSFRKRRLHFNPPCISNVLLEVSHPHGSVGAPRSILFGIDELPATPPLAAETALFKPLWAQSRVKYEHFFPDTELYLIFGCSLGDSDRWWWKRVANSLGRTNSRPHCWTVDCEGCKYCRYTALRRSGGE